MAEGAAALLAWLDARGFAVDARVAVEQLPHTGRAVVARAAMGAGTRLFTVPRAACLSAPNCAIAGILAELTEADTPTGRLVQLVLAVMYELWLGEASPWYPYIAYLPLSPSQPPVESSPRFWPEDRRRRLLAGTEAMREVEHALELMQESHERLVVPFLQQHAGKLGSEAAAFLGDCGLFHNTLAVVQAYSFTSGRLVERQGRSEEELGEGGVCQEESDSEGLMDGGDAGNDRERECMLEQEESLGEDTEMTEERNNTERMERDHSYDGDEGDEDDDEDEDDEEDDDSDEEDEVEMEVSVMMCPFADALNHWNTKNNARLVAAPRQERGDGSAEADTGDDAEPDLEMRTTRAVEAGEELFNTYGPLGDAELLWKYGFVEGNNRHDSVKWRWQEVSWCTAAACGVSPSGLEALAREFGVEQWVLPMKRSVGGGREELEEREERRERDSEGESEAEEWLERVEERISYFEVLSSAMMAGCSQALAAEEEREQREGVSDGSLCRTAPLDENVAFVSSRALPLSHSALLLLRTLLIDEETLQEWLSLVMGMGDSDDEAEADHCSAETETVTETKTKAVTETETETKTVTGTEITEEQSDGCTWLAWSSPSESSPVLKALSLLAGRRLRQYTAWRPSPSARASPSLCYTDFAAPTAVPYEHLAATVLEAELAIVAALHQHAADAAADARGTPL